MTEQEKRWDDSDESGNYKYIKFVTNGELRIPLWAWSQIQESLRAYYRQSVGLSEHVCDWKIKVDINEQAWVECDDRDCKAKMPVAEAEHHLNEHPKLQKYATHFPGCYENGEKCICGLNALLAEIEERNK